MSEPILEVENLIKNYGSYRAVDEISFVVPKGKVIGLLGPNGAGKTTTIQILCGITLHDGGFIKYFGKDFAKHKQQSLQRINFATAFNTLQGRISVYENLLVFAYLYSVKNPRFKILELLSYFEIEDLANQRYWDLSAGQKTRVNLVKSLINDPELILMDEPTASLDPDIADKTILLIEKLRDEKELSILFTSHDMEEVARVCDEVIFLDKGKIAAQDTPLGLTKKLGKASLRVSFESDTKRVSDLLKNLKAKFKYTNKNTVLIDTEEKDIPKIFAEFERVKISVTDIEVKRATLEDFFLKVARGE
jgi:ABC-2 type transport system ATP-binding protein